MLIVIDVKGDGRALPGSAFVGGTVGQHVVRFDITAAVVAAVGKHDQIVATGRKRCASFVQAPLRPARTVDDLPGDAGGAHKAEIAQRFKTARRSLCLNRHATDTNLRG